ncbi:MAG TPA: hypothetical protein VK911_00560 [Vicinamibacterales bacterium]|nr:hypothetical protein [Vicinamibacterales bacterium]
MTRIVRACCVVAGFLAVGSVPRLDALPQGPAPAVQQQIVQSTDPARRMQWFDEHAAMKAKSPFAHLRWRFIGPDIIGGRVTDVAVPKGSKKIIYVATATGGLWKTVNTGVTWEPIFDEQATLSMGDIAIPDSQPETIWVGTGEANHFRGSLAGAGVYKSEDGGSTWRHMGLTGTHTIGRIRVHPTDPNVVYVAATGHEWTYNEDRGVYRTADGGQTWQKVLYINEKVGAIDLIMDPRNPDVLIASMVNRVRLRWSDPVPAGEDGLFKTTDGGKTWKELTSGLPDTKTTGRIGIDLCLSKPDIVYAWVDNHTPVGPPSPTEKDAYGRQRTYPDIVGADGYRSDDLGETWRKVSPSDRTMQRFGGTYGWVFGQIRVDPNDENVVFLLGVPLFRSTDGGKSFQAISYENLHGDHHALWIDPTDSDYIINGNDGGANVSYDGGKTWRDFYKGIPSIQFYNVTLDNATPFNAYGSVQDWGTYRAVGVRPLDAAQGQRRRARSPMPKWETAPGGEGTHVAIDPTNPNIVYSSTFYGRLQRSEFVNGEWQSKDIYPKPAPGEPEHRGQWLAATTLSPHDPSTVYHGFQYVFRSKDKGETWEKISPDLTAFDPRRQGTLPYAINFATITAISESPLKAGVIYAGTDDGRVHVTQDGGAYWTEITAGLPYFKHVWTIVASKFDPATVYISLTGRHDDDFNAYVFRSTDHGRTWTSIGGGLPGGPTNVVREDPKNGNVLYVGTDLGAFVTTDGAKTWNYLGSGLPNASVWDLQVHPRDNMLVIATNGRGMWVIDNVADLRK